MIFRLLGLLNTNISNDTNIFSRGSYSVFLYAHGSHGSHGSLFAAGRSLLLEHEIIMNTNNPNDTNNFFCTRILLCFFIRTRIARIARILFAARALTGGLNTRFFEHE